MSKFQKNVTNWYDRARAINPKIFRLALTTLSITWYHDQNEILLPEIVLNEEEIRNYQKVCETYNGVILN